MYCVKCGVRLPDGVEACPLCGTPVWNPDGLSDENRPYSGFYPKPETRRRYPLLGFLTALLVAIDLTFLIFCLRTYHAVNWSGYVMLGSAVVYLICILPLWLRKPPALLFVPLSFAVVGGYLLYICLATGGHWFLSFAFPVTMLAGLITTAAVALFSKLRHKLFVLGGLMLAIGCSAMLVELFESITFDHVMFTWSLYVVSAFGAVGLFLLLAAMIPPLRSYLERKLFL